MEKKKRAVFRMRLPTKEKPEAQACSVVMFFPTLAEPEKSVKITTRKSIHQGLRFKMRLCRREI